MKAAELQIGDWVMYEDHPYQIRQLGIYDEDRDGNDYPAVCIGKPQGIGLIVERNEISPISITPEILLGNGFERDETHISTDLELVMDGVDIFIIIFDDGDIVVDIEKNLKDDVAGANRLHHCEIKYVHQLQQAMRLCGIDKEIKL